MQALLSVFSIEAPHTISGQVSARNPSNASFALAVGRDDINFVFPDWRPTANAKAGAPHSSDAPDGDHPKASLAVPPLEELDIPRRGDRAVDAPPDRDREGDAHKHGDSPLHQHLTPHPVTAATG